MTHSPLFRADLTMLRSQAPLVLNVTNMVSSSFVANALLAIGASPIVAHAPEEMEQMCAIAQALVLNIGTPDEAQIDSMLMAGTYMHHVGKPIVLDPVGAGATDYRTAAAHRLIAQCHPTIIRGNASEIMALTSPSVHSKGADSTVEPECALTAARTLATDTHSIVVISGATDYITDGKRTEALTGGSPLQARVTGMGCTASALLGAFAAVNNDAFEAALHGMMVMNIAGEHAAAQAKRPGTMMSLFIDEIDHLCD